MRGKPRVLGLLLLPFLAGCETVPITGRKQLILLSRGEETSIGTQAYQETLSKAELVKEGPDYDMVVRIGQRIAAVSDDPGFQWEFNLIRDDQTVNAFCLPGGKVAVFTGILPVTETEAGLATVMGHEIAHAIARHGNERVSLSLPAEAVGSILEVGLAKESSATRDLVMAAFGKTKDVAYLLPYSRTHESEADHIGLIYMARAGYDPREAVAFWTRMAAQSQGERIELLSTHPSDETRVADLERLLPEALREYEKGRTSP